MTSAGRRRHRRCPGRSRRPSSGDWPARRPAMRGTARHRAGRHSPSPAPGARGRTAAHTRRPPGPGPPTCACRTRWRRTQPGGATAMPAPASGRADPAHRARRNDWRPDPACRRRGEGAAGCSTTRGARPRGRDSRAYRTPTPPRCNPRHRRRRAGARPARTCRGCRRWPAGGRHGLRPGYRSMPGSRHRKSCRARPRTGPAGPPRGPRPAC